jgi:hypothetical protein
MVQGDTKFTQGQSGRPDGTPLPEAGLLFCRASVVGVRGRNLAALRWLGFRLGRSRRASRYRGCEGCL